uniref:Uncharacterized protein n=1 Tax=Sinocyclocheilus grahami TaxID=75366 RepID=A0A672QPA1_SINGR
MSDGKPFLCTAPGCGQRFAIKADEHELLLFMALWATVADQTPTPTRFLKNCEEVGLFNELTSPFEHDFKKATEDDIKKVKIKFLVLFCMKL